MSELKQRAKRYLCICDYGQVRSVAMAYFILLGVTHPIISTLYLFSFVWLLNKEDEEKNK